MPLSAMIFDPHSTRWPRWAGMTLLTVGLWTVAGCAQVSVTSSTVDATATVPLVPGCPDHAQVDALVKRYASLQAMPAPQVPPSPEAAACGAARWVAALRPSLGPVVGYKAGLTNPAVQQRFGIASPLRGTLLKGMLLADGATVPARFGAMPFAEPDLVVEVASAGIHGAATPLEVLGHLRSVRPFIELPDTLLEDPSKINANLLTFLNVGARLGVLGAPIPVVADAAFAERLRTMTVVATDSSGQELSRAPGAAILGHPLNAVLWLAADLKKAGITLQPGDLLSLGAFGNLAVSPGQRIRVRYEGLPGQPSVSVSFR
jgi:2-keto-4-pentenoate hydratase